LLVLISWILCGPAAAQDIQQEGNDAIREGDRFLRQFKAADALASYKEGIRIGQETHNDYMYAMALVGAGQAIWYKGNLTGAADTVELALKLFRKANNIQIMAWTLRILSNIYDNKGDYENAFKTVREALDIYTTSVHDNQNKTLSLVQMGQLYKSIGDYEAASEYYAKAWEEDPRRGTYEYRELNHRNGELYVAMNKVDSARYFYRNAIFGSPNNNKTIRLLLGESFLLSNNTDSALAYLGPLYKEENAGIDLKIMIATMLGLGKIYLVKHDLPAAMDMAQGAYQMSVQGGARQNKRDACQLLSDIYEAQGNTITALQYRKRYEEIKDSVVSDQFKGQLYSFKQSAALESLKEDKRTAKRIIAVICIAAILLFFLLTLRHKNEKLRLKQRAAVLEMKALRSQMNPHFIFNCLSAINHFILNNETDRASEYLTRFSRLMRMVLVNAGKTTISLEEELNMLKLYLNMEQLRFKDAFDYFIYCDPEVQPSMVNVPSFVLQPFCENAIWHGLLHKEGKGQLNIHLKMKAGILICTIKDNGIGMEKAAELKTGSVEKQYSFGHKLSAERLALFNGKNNGGASFTIQDVKDETGNTTGTVVTLQIKNNKQVYD
jgi:tetratricopeptide (TPR) repeat protein